MIEASGQPDFTQKPVAAKRRGGVGVQHFDGDIPAVAKILSQVDCRHSATTKLALDSIAVLECVFELLPHLLSILSMHCVSGKATARAFAQ
jgi:hypothetical protein